MISKITAHWKLISLVMAGLGIIWMSNSAVRLHDQAIESLYQQVQTGNRAEFARRQANIARLEAIESQTALAYQTKIDQAADAANKKIQTLKWKSNEQLTKEKASAEEVKKEKKKVEDALDVMTINRDKLKTAAETREKEIAKERLDLKAEHVDALAAKQKEFDLCEKARKNASCRRTWISIGPSSMVYIRDGVVWHNFGLSIQIPIIQIKSPFKRF